MHPSLTAPQISAIIAQHCLESKTLQQAFKKQGLQKAISNLKQIDEAFQANGGTLFACSPCSFETAKDFTKIHVRAYRQGSRPSLPALAAEHANILGLDQNTALYKAMIMIAMRTERPQACTPDYHCKNHYVDVTALMGNMLKRNRQLVKAGAQDAVPLTKDQEALALIAALGHDLDHEGRGNPTNDHYANERSSFEKMRPLLEEAGLSKTDIHTIWVMLKTTSPNGPHSVIKHLAKAYRNTEKPDWSLIDPDQKFQDLKSDLNKNAPLIAMCSMLSDSDLYASGGTNMETNAVMSDLLTKEANKSGVNMDFCNDNARQFFLENIIGEDGFASAAGRDIANDTFNALHKKTCERLEKQAQARNIPRP